MRKYHLLTLAAAVALTVTAAACTEVDESGPDSPGTTTKPAVTTTATSAATSPEETEPPVTTEAGTVVPVIAPVGNGLTLEEIAKLDAQAVQWGPGVQVDAQNRPTAPIALQEKYGKYDALFIKDPDGSIYLTFDEGYENGYTPAILDTLKEKGVHAVFFVTYDYAKRQPELVQRMIDEGHIVGNHSWTHPVGGLPTQSLEEASGEITKLHEYVKEHFNYTMTLFRPPEGAFSEQTLALAQSLGYKTVLWSFAYADWDPNQQMGYDAAYKKVTGAMHDGGIFLLHAVSKDNSEILPAVIDKFEDAGYSFKLLQ